MQYGREEAAEPLIEQMTRDADPIIRYGGMYVIGMAYRYGMRHQRGPLPALCGYPTHRADPGNARTLQLHLLLLLLFGCRGQSSVTHSMDVLLYGTLTPARHPE